MRLIDADELREQCDDPFWCVWLGDIDNAPTIDAAPVKHGEWVIDLRGNWACSVCGNDPYHYNMENMNYCPNCGAKMDGGKDDGMDS